MDILKEIKLFLIVTLSSVFFFWFGINFPFFCFLPVFPLVYYFYIKNDVSALLAVGLVITGSFILIFNLYFALFYLFFIVVIAIFMVFSFKNHIDSRTMFTAIIIYDLIFLAVLFLIIYNQTGKTVVTIITEQVDKFVQGSGYPAFINENTELLDKLKEYSKEIHNFWLSIKDMFYSIVIVFMSLSFIISYKIGRIFLRKLGVHIQHIFINKMWKPKDDLVVGIVFALLLLVLYKILLKDMHLINIIGKNLLFIFIMPYILNGFMIFHFFTFKYRVPLIFNTFFYVLLLLNPLIILSLGIFGIMDVWLCFRERVLKKK